MTQTTLNSKSKSNSNARIIADTLKDLRVGLNNEVTAQGYGRDFAAFADDCLDAWYTGRVFGSIQKVDNGQELEKITVRAFTAAQEFFDIASDEAIWAASMVIASHVNIKGLLED